MRGRAVLLAGTFLGYYRPSPFNQRATGAQMIKNWNDGLRIVGSALACAVVAWALSGSMLGCDGDADSSGGGYSNNQKKSGRQDRGRGAGKYNVTVEESEYDVVSQGDTQFVEGGDPEELPPPRQYEWVYSLEYESLIISPDGNNVLMMVPRPGPAQGFETPGLVLNVQPIPGGTARCIPQVQDVARMNFTSDGKLALLLNETGTRLQILNLETYSITGTIYFDRPFSVVDVTPDGSHAVLTNLPTNDAEDADFSEVEGCASPPSFGSPAGASMCEAGFVDLATGEYWVELFSHALRDLDFDPVFFDPIFTYSFQYDDVESINKSHMLFYSVGERQVTEKLVFNNCADEVVISPTAMLALLGPVTCQIWQQDKLIPEPAEPIPQDPISIIDLEERSFVENLPGFGPVALSEKWQTAIGFTTKGTMQSDWDYFGQSKPFGLIFVDLQTLDWDVINWGSEVPAYTVSPDGNYLYAQDAGLDPYGNPNGGLSRVNLLTHVRKKVSGGELTLDDYAWQPGSSSIYLLHAGSLYHIPDSGLDASLVEQPVAATLINVRPQGDILLLGESDKPAFHALSLGPEGPVDTPTTVYELAL